MIRARVIGSGSYLPSNIVTNDDLAKRVDTSDTWIRERTGITQRTEILAREKTVARGITQGAGAASGMASAMRLCAVFNDDQTMRLGHRIDGRHVSRLPVEMHRQNSLGP